MAFRVVSCVGTVSISRRQRDPAYGGCKNHMCQENACTNRKQLSHIVSMTLDTWYTYKHFIKIHIIYRY